MKALLLPCLWGYSVAVSASEEPTSIKFLKQVEGDNTELFPLGSGNCFNYKTDMSEFYDLKSFDVFLRDEKNHQPAATQIAAMYDFYYKACQPAWGMTQEYLESL